MKSFMSYKQLIYFLLCVFGIDGKQIQMSISMAVADLNPQQLSLSTNRQQFSEASKRS